MQTYRWIMDQDLYKLIQWADGPQKFHDLRSDYYETVNCIHDPQRQHTFLMLANRIGEIFGPIPVEH